MTTPSKNIDCDPIRLLIVDDEKDFVNILSKRIKRRHIDVAKAFSGAEAIQALRGQEFDVAVLDLKMEDMDGIEVLRMLKNKIKMLTIKGNRINKTDYAMYPFVVDWQFLYTFK